MDSPARHWRARDSALLATQHRGPRQRAGPSARSCSAGTDGGAEHPLTSRGACTAPLSGRLPPARRGCETKEKRAEFSPPAQHPDPPRGDPPLAAPAAPRPPRRDSPDFTTTMPAAVAAPPPLTAAGPVQLRRPASPSAGTQGLQKGADSRGKGRTVRAEPGRVPHRQEERSENRCGGSATAGGRRQPHPSPPPSILCRSATARLAVPAPEAFIAVGGWCAARSPHLPRLICQRQPQKGSARRRRCVNTGHGRVHGPNGPGGRGGEDRGGGDLADRC